MNKLISKSPILRFKLGSKITKALNGLEFPRIKLGLNTDYRQSLIPITFSELSNLQSPLLNYTIPQVPQIPEQLNFLQPVLKRKSSGKRVTSFGKAFKEARNAGLREFTYNGRRISTRLAGESNQLWADNLNRNKAKFVLTPEDLNPGPIPYALENPPVNTPELLQDRISNLNFYKKLGGQLTSKNPVERFRNKINKN